MASTEGQSYPDGREGGSGWVGRCVCVGLGGVTANLCRRRKENRLWQNILKALLGDDWLIAPSPITRHRHRQQVHFIHLYDNIYIVLTVGAPLFCQNQQSNKNREETRHRLGGASHLQATDTHTAGRGSDVTSALTVLLSSRGMFLKVGGRIKMAMTSTAAAVSRHKLRLLEFHD